MANVKQEATYDMTAQEEAWIAGRSFFNDAQRARFLAFRSGGRLGLLSVLKQQSENLFPGQSTPMSIDASNTARKIDSSILTVFRDFSDKQIEALILNPIPEYTSRNDKDESPTLIAHEYHGVPDRPGIYGIFVRNLNSKSMSPRDYVQILEDLEAYHAGLVLDVDRGVMIRRQQTAAEAQKFQRIDEQEGECHYVETSLLQNSTRRYCTTQEHLTEYQGLAAKWRDICATISARSDARRGGPTDISIPLFTDIGVSTSLKATAQQWFDDETSGLMDLVDAIAQTYRPGYKARMYLVAPLPDAEIIPIAEHVFALLVDAYRGHGGVKEYAAVDLTKFAARGIPSERRSSERRTKVRDDPRVKIEHERDVSIVTAHPEMFKRATAVVSHFNMKRKSLPEQEQITATAEEAKQLWVEDCEELEQKLRNRAIAARSAANAAERRCKKLKVAADKIEKLVKMALIPDEDIVEVEEEDEDNVEVKKE